MSWTNQTKNNSSYTNQTKDSSTFTTELKSGSPWTYNQSGYTYNQANDPLTSDVVRYNSIGTTVTWTNQTKN